MSALLQALAGVALGAVLATFGGFMATQATALFDRRRGEAGAALLCGEVLAAIEALMRLAVETAGEGGFQNPLTLRFLHAIQREVDVYDRNREMLFRITDADLRARIHSFMVRVSMPLEQVFDAEARLSAPRAETAIDAAAVQYAMDRSGAYFFESRRHIAELLLALQPFARERLDVYRRVNSDGLVIRAAA